jgi:hypothetical protein
MMESEINDGLDRLVWMPEPMEASVRWIDHEPITDGFAGLFWDDPMWHYVKPSVADHWAKAVSTLGIAVAALTRDVATQTSSSSWMDDANLPRILPYRNERFGIQRSDFDRADAIDVRLTRHRSEEGRWGYNQQELQRLGVVTQQSFVASMGLPPEITKVGQLERTIDALRGLTEGRSKILVSVSAASVAQDFPALMSLNWDGFVLRGDDDGFDGLILASILQEMRTQLTSIGKKDSMLWVVPPPLSADNIAKLIVLGADAVAVDAWCDPFLWNSSDPTSFLSSGDRCLNQVQTKIGGDVDRVRGLVHAAKHRQSSSALGTTDPEISHRLGLPLITTSAFGSKAKTP